MSQKLADLFADYPLLTKTWAILGAPLFELSGTKVSFISIVMAVLVFGIALKLSNLAEKVIHRRLANANMDIGVRTSLARSAKYLVVIIGALITLDSLGISLHSLAALGAVLMVGIGFGLQNITQNFIAGLILMIERPIKNGDMVEVHGTKGRIQDIRARYTLIQTRDDISIIVPNSQFIAEQVVNDSFSGERIRLRVTVGVAYGSDVQKVKKLLEKVAHEHPDVLPSPPARVFFKDFGASSLDFELRVWTKELWGEEITKSDLRFAIDKSFRDNDITIPFPQTDLHIKSSDVSFK